MSNRAISISLIILGILILAAVVLAGPLHLASNTYGAKHIIGLVVGCVVLLAGIAFSFYQRQIESRK